MAPLVVLAAANELVTALDSAIWPAFAQLHYPGFPRTNAAANLYVNMSDKITVAVTEAMHGNVVQDFVMHESVQCMRIMYGFPRPLALRHPLRGWRVRSRRRNHMLDSVGPANTCGIIRDEQQQENGQANGWRTKSMHVEVCQRGKQPGGSPRGLAREVPSGTDPAAQRHATSTRMEHGANLLVIRVRCWDGEPGPIVGGLSCKVDCSFPTSLWSIVCLLLSRPCLNNANTWEAVDIDGRDSTLCFARSEQL